MPGYTLQAALRRRRGTPRLYSPNGTGRHDMGRPYMPDGAWRRCMFRHPNKSQSWKRGVHLSGHAVL